MRRITIGDYEANRATYKLINSVLDSGRISYGPISRRLEGKFASLHDSRFAVLSSSGTASLQTALQAMKEVHNWDDGDEVIVPAVTFVATVNIVIHNNMKPVVVDVDRRTYNIDPALIADKITDRTRAIIPVHLFGQPANMTAINAIARKHNLKVIEDSCESMLATHNLDPVGSLGDIGCFSMYMAHILTAGVGGIATTSDVAYAEKMRSLVNHGRDGIYISIDDDDTSDRDELAEIMQRRFRFESVGHSARITELEAALALAQIDELPYNVAMRQENAEFLGNNLAHLDEYIQLPYTETENTHSFMMFPIVVRDGSKWPLCDYLEEAGVETREMLPLTNQPVYSNMLRESDYPVAQWINNSGFYVGCHPRLSYEDVYHVARTIIDFFEGTNGRK